MGFERKIEIIRSEFIVNFKSPQTSLKRWKFLELRLPEGKIRAASFVLCME